MRDDMFKVIVERPRRGGMPPKRVKRIRLDDEGEYKGKLKEGMKPKCDYDERKELNENLSPLRRFLEKNVGRPWDKVYSEVSLNLDPSNAVKQHVRDHLHHFVEIHVEVLDGVPFYKSNGYKHFGPTPLRKGTLWVDPASGILRRVKRDFKNKSRGKSAQEQLEKLAMEYFEFVRLEIKSDWRGILHGTADTLTGVRSWNVLSDKHVVEDIKDGRYNKAWFDSRAKKKLKTFHPYFAALFQRLKI